MGELLRRFTEFLSKSQTSLITIGYSFSDSHLNQIIKRALLNPSLQLVICLPEIKSFESKDIEAIKDKKIQSLLRIESPQITVISGENAYFNSFVKYLPEPVIYDEYALKIKKILKDNKENNHEKNQSVTSEEQLEVSIWTLKAGSLLVMLLQLKVLG